MDAPTIDRVEHVVQPAVPGGIARTWMVIHGHHEDGAPYVGGHRTYREHAGEPAWSVRAEAKVDLKRVEVERYRHPPAFMPGRPAQPHEIPAGAKAVLKLAAAAGFETRASYAFGMTAPDWRPDPSDLTERIPDPETGKLPTRRTIWMGRPAESVAIVGRAPGRRFLASWENRQTATVLIFEHNDVRVANVTELKKWITT